nr:receptor-like protein kinase FERONIA [Tanacetum cinerariifolium]
MSQKCLIDYAKIVECCLHADPRSRSTMAEVLVGLESILDKTTSDMSLGKHISSGLKS